MIMAPVSLRNSFRKLETRPWEAVDPPHSEEPLPAQPVDATPSDIDLFSKSCVYDSREAGKTV